MYKLLITCSGTGSRLGEWTRNNNKALIRVGNKLIVDHIIENYTNDVPLVVTIGYQGEKVISHLKAKYPDRNIVFVEVGLYEGPGSSLGYSLLRTRKYLQCPFIFHCNDTIVRDVMPDPNSCNWNAGVCKQSNISSSQYTTFSAEGGYVYKFFKKGSLSFSHYHVGVVGIKDYKIFWDYLDEIYKQNPNDPTLNDVSALDKMVANHTLIRVVTTRKWYDTGNLLGLQFARVQLQ